ncbi:MAG: UxaA family hydrolase, partial [Pseudomonadota bacterium]
MNNWVRLDAADNVVTAIKPLEAGAPVEDIATTRLIPRGHKIAVRPIAEGEQVIKYNQVIGYATRDLNPGEHVHVDECEFRATDVDYVFGTDLRNVEMVAEAERDTFMGYRRADGRVGTRNYIAVLSSVNCSATACKMIADAYGPAELAAFPNIDGVASFTHGTGCGNYGEGFEALQRVMWGYARHPNVGGVLMVGLGCEGNQIEWLMEAFGLEIGPRFQWMNIQNMAGLRRTIEAGIKKIEKMLPVVNDVTRVPCPSSDLTVALQCGGSDAWSGITANPAVGYASDLLVAQGGTTVLGETPEIYGAEHLLAARANETEGKKLLG